MGKILLSENKIKELKKRLKVAEKSLKEQNKEQVSSGGVLSSWHESASFNATQGALKSEIKNLRNILRLAKILPDKVECKEIRIGNKVEIKREDDVIFSYKLVHPLESDPHRKLISIESPLGKKIKGKSKGEVFRFKGKQFKISSFE